jgi:hypothetical protein
VNCHQEIEWLDGLLKDLHRNHPNTYVTLRIANMTFRACTKKVWNAHGWTVKDEEVTAILNGNDHERKAALLSLLTPQYINNIEIIPGVDILDMVVPESESFDQ